MPCSATDCAAIIRFCMKKCGFTTVNGRPHPAISASERACRRLLRFGASCAAPTADIRTTCFTPPSRAAQSAFDAWIGALGPGGVSSHATSTPSNAPSTVRRSDRSPVRSSTPWRREVLGLGRVANETDQAMAGALQGADHGGGDIAGRTGEKDRGHADTIAPRSGLRNWPSAERIDHPLGRAASSNGTKSYFKRDKSVQIQVVLP